MAGLDETKKPNPLQSDQAAAGTDTGSNKPATGISALDAFSGTTKSNQFGLGAVGTGTLAGPASAADMSALGFAKAGGQQIVDFVAKDKKLETGIAAVDLVGNTGLGFINTTIKMNSAAVELIAVPSKLSTTVEGLKHLPSALPGMLAETGNNLWNGDWATKGQTLGNTAAFLTLTFGAAGGPKSGAAIEGTAARSTSWLSRTTSGLKNWWQGADEVAAASADDLLASAMKTPRGGSVVELPGGATRPLATDLPIPVVREPAGVPNVGVPKVGEPGYVAPKVGEPGYVAPKVGEPGYVEPTTPVGTATRLHGPAGEGPVVNVPNRGLGTLPENALVAPLQDAAAATTSTVVRDIAEVAPRMSRLGDDLGTLGLKGEEVAALQRQITAFAKGEVESGAVEATVQGLRSKVASGMAGKFDEIVNNAVKDVGDFRAAQIAAKTNPVGVANDALVGTAGTRVTGGNSSGLVDEAAIAGATQDVTTTISRVEQAAAKAPAAEVNALKTTIDDFAKGTATAEKLDQAVTAVRRTLTGDDLAAFDAQMASARRAAEAAQQARGIATTVRPIEVAPVEVAPTLKPVETATVKVTETSTEAATALRNVESTAAKAGEAEVAALRNTFEDVVNGKAGLSKLDEAAAAVKAKLPTNDAAAFEAEMAKARQAAQTAQEARGALQTLDNAAPAVAKPFKVADVAPTPVETATVNVSRTSTDAATSLRNVESAAAKAGETEVAALRNTFEDVVNGKAGLNKLDEAAAAVKAKLPTNDVAAFEAEMAKARQAAQAAQEARGALQSLDNAAPAVSKPFKLADEPVVPRDTTAPVVREPVVKEPSATPAEATSRAQTSIREAEDVVKKSLGEADAAKLRTEFDNMMSGKPNKFAETVEDIQSRLRAASKTDELASVTRNTENAAAEAARARTLAGEPAGIPPKVTETAPPKVTETGPPKGTTGDGVVPPKEAPTPVQAKQSFTDSAGTLKDDLAGVTSRTSTKAQQALDKFAELTNPTVKDVAALERALGKVSDVSPEIAAKVQQALADARTLATATAVERAAALTRATEEAAAVTSATTKGGTAATTDAAAATNVAGKTTDVAASSGAKLAQAEANLAKAWENFHNTTVPGLVQALKAPLERMGLTGEELATKISSIKQIEELARKAGSADVTGGLATKWADTQFMGALKNRLEMYKASISGSATAGEMEVIDRAIAALQNSQRALSGARSGVLSDMTWLQQIGRSFSDHPFYNAWRTSFMINAPLRILYDAGKYHQDQEAAKDAKNGITNGGAAAGTVVGGGTGATVKPADAKDKVDNDGQPHQPGVQPGQLPGNQGTGEKKVEVLPRQTGDSTVERTSMTLPGTSDQLKTTQISHSGEPAIVSGGPFRVNAAEPLDNYSQLILRNAQRFGLSTPFAPRGYVAPPIEEARVVMPFANRAKFAGIETGSADFAKTSYTPFVAAGKSLLSLDAVRVMSANPAMAVGTDSKGRALLTPTSTDPISALNARGLVFATAGLGGEGKLIDSKQREAMRKVNTDRRTRGGGAVAGQQGIQFTAVAAPPGAQLTTGTGSSTDPSNNDEDNNGVAQTATVAQTNTGADPDDTGINLTTV